MSDIESFIEATNAAETPEEIFVLFQKALRRLGYDRVCYSLITDHPSLGLPAGHGVMRNYPDEWMSHYMAKGYDRIDPVPRYCFATARPFTWDWIINHVELANDQKRVMDEAREALLLDGMAVPLYGQNGELAGVGLASSSGKIESNMNLLSKVRAIAYQFHIAYTERQRAARDGGIIHLTPREKEILLWAAEGKGDGVIAEILGISYSAVRFHMNNVFHKIGVNDRTLAVAKAIRLGLILPTYVSLDYPIEVAS